MLERANRVLTNAWAVPLFGEDLPAATPRQTIYCPQTRDLVTLRVTVVKRCVEAAVWQQWRSTPLAALKQWSPAFHSANGFKETRMEDGALFLECSLKVDRPEFLAKNGQGAVFVSRLASEQGRKLPCRMGATTRRRR